MKILMAVDRSKCTKRMLAWPAVHEEWFGPEHSHTAIDAVLVVPHRWAGAE